MKRKSRHFRRPPALNCCHPERDDSRSRLDDFFEDVCCLACASEEGGIGREKEELSAVSTGWLSPVV